jgi:hypothetical protein
MAKLKAENRFYDCKMTFGQNDGHKSESWLNSYLISHNQYCRLNLPSVY